MISESTITRKDGVLRHVSRFLWPARLSFLSAGNLNVEIVALPVSRLGTEVLEITLYLGMAVCSTLLHWRFCLSTSKGFTVSNFLTYIFQHRYLPVVETGSLLKVLQGRISVVESERWNDNSLISVLGVKVSSELLGVLCEGNAHSIKDNPKLSWRLQERATVFRHKF